MAGGWVMKQRFGDNPKVTREQIPERRALSMSLSSETNSDTSLVVLPLSAMLGIWALTKTSLEMVVESENMK